MIVTTKIKSLIRELQFKVYNNFGFYKQYASSVCKQKKVCVLMYHGLVDNPKQAQLVGDLHITPRSLSEGVQFYLDQGYEALSLEDILDCSHKVFKAALLVTFDDGYANCSKPLLDFVNRYEIPILLAVCPNLVGTKDAKWWEEIQVRFSLTNNSNISFYLHGREFCYESSIKGMHNVMRDIQVLSSDSLLEFLKCLRSATSDVSEKSIMQSPLVHPLMSWDQLTQVRQAGIVSAIVAIDYDFCSSIFGTTSLSFNR